MRTGVISRMCALSCYGPAAATQRHRMLEKRMCAPGLSSLVGAAVGGIGGAVGGSTAAEKIVDKSTESEDGNPDTENYATSDICPANL